MCGIAGIHRSAVPIQRSEAMIRALAHRGPDALDHWSNPDPGLPIFLGHARLSIIDLSSAANQPFKKHEFVLIYNGELYNYRELQSELRSEGVAFQTSSDSEVIVEAWRKWGAECLRRFRGMFAFALFDQRSRRLYLARDHFGIKPLFYSDRKDGFFFASELKALRQVIDHLPLDMTGVVASVMYSWVPEDHCVYQGVNKLAPGTWMEVFPDGASRVHRYWDPITAAQEAEESGLANPTTAAELGRVIDDSVRAHLVADVPVSTFLSGGLDSSLVTVMANKHDAEIDSYTISFREQDRRFEAMPDDLKFARKVAASVGIHLHEVEIAPDIAELLPKLVCHLDEPIGDAAAINAFLICEAARASGRKVLLSGMGADEFFAGYRRHYASLLAFKYRRLPALVRSGVIEPIVKRLPAAGRRRGYRISRWAHRFVDFAGLDEASAFLRSYAHYDRSQLLTLLSVDATPHIDDVIDRHHAIYESYTGTDVVNRMCLADIQLFLPGLNLAYTDRASMAASTEVRVPFVDKEVFAAAFAIAGRRKIVGAERKAILKEAAKPWLPPEIIYRPKGLFSAPLRAWIRRDLQSMVESVVIEGENVNSGLFDRAAVRRMVDADRAGQGDYSKEIWHLLTLELWRQQAREPSAHSGISAGVAQ